MRSYFFSGEVLRASQNVSERKLMLARHAEHWTSEGLLLVLHKGTIRV